MSRQFALVLAVFVASLGSVTLATWANECLIPHLSVAQH